MLAADATVAHVVFPFDELLTNFQAYDTLVLTT